MTKSDKIINEENKFNSSVSDINSTERSINEQLPDEYLEDVSGGTVYDVAFKIMKSHSKGPK